MATNYKHLGNLGLQQLIQLLYTEFGLYVKKVDGKDLSTNDFTDILKNKLEGIAEGANKYTHATFNANALAFYKVQTNEEGHVVAVEAVKKEDITALGIPGQDTTYVVATQSADGLMAAADKIKIDGIEAGANKYVHATHGAYESGIYKITVDAEGHVSAASAVTKADLDAIIKVATQTEDGLLSAADKKKIDELGSLASKSEVAESDLAAELKEKVNAASEGNHAHLNKALLDTYTQTEENLADAVAKKHSHTFNEAELNKIAEGDKAKWDQAAADADAIKADYLKNSDKEALNKAISDEAARAAGKEAELAGAITSGDATTLQSAKDYADQKIASQISSAYKAGGTKAYEELPEPAAEYEGYVYNISNAFTTDADFVEGAGHQYVAGTNVVIVEESEGVFKYDVLAMSFDGFVQEANISEYTADEVNTLWNSVFTA